MIRIAFLFLLAGMVGLAGCQSKSPPKDYTPTSARFFLESATADGMPQKLPQSGVHISVNSQPVIVETDILNVELVQVELGRCLLFQLTSSASRDFYRMTATHQGRRLVLLIDNMAFGARRIDGVIANGALFVFVEMPEADLPALVHNLKKSSIALQQELSRR